MRTQEDQRMRLALYARVSTAGQRLEPQLDALRAYAARRGAAEVREYLDHGQSGRRDSRPALDTLMRAVMRREVDAVAVTKLDRLARSVRHLCELADTFKRLDVDMVVLDQALDTSTASGRLLFGVLSVVAAFEADLLRERTVAGLAAARRRGRKLGRPRARLDVPHALERILRGEALAAVARDAGVSRATLRARLTEWREVAENPSRSAPDSAGSPGPQ
jgi:DNA invertase Pin-like site-specific DNA recombinase